MLALADCCDADDTLILQEKFAHAQTPEELYDLIPTVLPQENACLKKAVQTDFWNGQAAAFGVYKLMNWHILEGTQRWDWKNMANLFNDSDLFDMGLMFEDGEVVEC